MSEENQKSVAESNNKEQPYRPWDMELNTFCMLMHLSQLAGIAVPFAGLVLPIVMWATNKDKSPEVNLHGLSIFNWMLSALIYGFVSLILCFIFIGVFGLLALFVVNIVFAILGGVKANNAEYWPYPLAIDFFGVKKKLQDLAE